MKTIIILVFCFLPILFFGQSGTEIRIRFPGSKQIRESYFVLDTNPDIKNGKYIRYYKTSNNNKNAVPIKKQGIYKNGLKEGKWIYFKHPTNNIQGQTTSVEFYKNGLKTGIWEKYHSEKDGTVIERYDFDLNTKLEPIISVRLNYPFLAKENGTQGEVIIKYLIRPDCSIENIEIVKSLETNCDKEAIQSILKMSRLQKKYSLNKCDLKEEIKTIKFSLE